MGLFRQFNGWEIPRDEATHSHTDGGILAASGFAEFLGDLRCTYTPNADSKQLVFGIGQSGIQTRKTKKPRMKQMRGD